MSVNYDFPFSNYLYEVRESQMIVNSMYFHDWTDENRFKYKKKTHEKCDTSHLCEEIWRGDDLVVHFVQFIQFFCEFVPIVHYSVTTHCSNKKQNLLQIQIVHIYCKLYQHFLIWLSTCIFGCIELTPPCLIIQECAFFDNEISFWQQ